MIGCAIPQPHQPLNNQNLLDSYKNLLCSVYCEMYNLGDYPEISSWEPFKYRYSSLFRFPDERRLKVDSQDALMIQHMMDNMRHCRRMNTAALCLAPVLPKDVVKQILAAIPRGSLSPSWVDLLERPSKRRLTTRSLNHIMITGRA